MQAAKYYHSHIHSTSSLGKPSIFAKARPLEGLRIMIADSDHRLALTIENILFALGCKSVVIVHDGIDALATLKEQDVDIIITEHAIRSIDGLTFIQHLRQGEASPHRDVPVVMMTAHNDRQHVEAARDCGVDEYVLKPFAAKSLLERIYGLIEKPRSFILSSSYIGPDRRRTPQNDNFPKANRPDGRPFIARLAPRVVSKAALYSKLSLESPCVILPDYSLKKKLGFAVAPPLKVNMVTMRAPRGKELLLDGLKQLKDAFEMQKKHSYQPTIFIAQMQKTAQTINRQARENGFERVSQVAVLLMDFCKHYYSPSHDQHMKVIYTYIDAISTLITNDIRGSGGVIGEALYQNLYDLMLFYGTLRPAS